MADFHDADLRVVLNEEWEHRRYAERDLDALEPTGAAGPVPAADRP